MATKLFAKTIGVAGYRSCGFANMALTKAKHLQELGHVASVDESAMFDSRADFQKWLGQNGASYEPVEKAAGHKTSPFVFYDSKLFIGGGDDFFEWVEKARV